MGIEDRDWYREYHKEKKTKGMAKPSAGWNDASTPEPLSKSSMLYMSVTLNAILIGSLIYVLYR